MRQQTIVDHLERRVSPGSAAFFRNACHLLADAESNPALTHLVSHLLREVESAVRAVLEPVDAARGVTSGRHQARILAVLDVLGVSRHDPVAQFWLDLANEGPPLGLAARAHRPGLDAPRPADAEFYDFVYKLELLLERVLDRMETTYVETLDRLDVLLTIDQPTAAHADQLKNKTPNIPLTLDYFFTRASADWLALLRDRKFFSTPPEVQIDEGGAVPTLWSASGYLARVAPQVPDAAVEVAVALPETDNPWVNHDVVKTALGVPPADSKRLVSRVIESLSSRFGVLVPRDAARLISHLAAGGESDAAFGLGAALLGGLVRGEGRTRTLDTYTFAEILKTDFPALVGVDGLRALALISNLLAGSIAEKLSASAEELGGQDGSHVWREHVEGDSIVGEFDPTSALAQAVWNTADRLLASQTYDVEHVASVLAGRDWLIFDRIIMALLAAYGQDVPKLVASKLTDPVLMADLHAEHEVLRLMSAQSGVMDEADVHAMLGLIREGPNVAPLVELYRSSGDVEEREPPESVVNEYVGRWQLKRLAAAAPVLTGEAQALRERLALEHGAEAARSAASGDASRDGGFHLVQSPISVNDLAAMAPRELVETLNTWQPPSDRFLGPTRGTLATALASMIDQDASNRSAQAQAFIGVDPIFAAAIVNGFLFAARRGAPMDWTPLVNFCAWIGRQADGELKTMTGDDRRAWRDARSHSMSLLTAGLRGRPSLVQPVCAPMLLSAIAAASEDPDPSVEEELRACAGGDTVSGLALNRVRPLAIEAAVMFGFWLRNLDAAADVSAVIGIADRELAAPSGAARRSVRLVIGQHYPLLFLLDQEWATANVPRIFPAGEAEQPLWGAAWTGFLAYAALSKDVCRVLRDQYARAAVTLELDADEHHPNAFTVRLGVHLLWQYLFGEIEIDSPDGLLTTYYAGASRSVRAYLASMLGRDLDNMTDPAMLARFAALWDWRSEAASHSSDIGELYAFGAWFGSGRFDDAWALRHLARAIGPHGPLEAADRVLSRLARLASTHTSACVAALEKWVRTSPTPWSLSQTEQEMRLIIAAGLASDSPGTVETAKTIINLLLTQQCDLRDLLD